MCGYLISIRIVFCIYLDRFANLVFIVKSLAFLIILWFVYLKIEHWVCLEIPKIFSKVGIDLNLNIDVITKKAQSNTICSHECANKWWCLYDYFWELHIIVFDILFEILAGLQSLMHSFFSEWWVLLVGIFRVHYKEVIITIRIIVNLICSLPVSYIGDIIHCSHVIFFLQSSDIRLALTAPHFYFLDWLIFLIP